MKVFWKKCIDTVSPVAGVGAVAACPVCWGASAVFLSFIGLGGVITVWPKIALILIAFGVLGFFLDYRKHRQPIALSLFLVGVSILFAGRYHYADMAVWVPGALLMVFAVIHNRYILTKGCTKIASCCS